MKRKPRENIEALAAKARAARENSCQKEVMAVLEKHNCQASVVVQVNGAQVPIGEVFRLPVSILVGSK